MRSRPLQGPETPRQRVAVLRAVSEVEELREFWTSCPSHRVVDLDFYLLALAESPRALHPYVIVSYDAADRPRTMLIGWLEETKMDIGFRYLSARLPTVRSLALLYQGWVGDISSADSDQFIGQIIESLRAGEATMAVLHKLNIESPLFGSATALPGFLIADHMTRPEIHRAIQMLDNGKNFLANLSKGQRHNHRRRARKLAEDFPGRARIERFTDIWQVDRLMQDAERITATSYQRGMGRGFLNSEAMRRLLELEARKGTLRGFVLYLEDRPCSYWITSLYGGTLYSEAMAFDPNYREYAPGMYLVINAIAELVDSSLDNRAQRIDPGFGDYDWKIILSNESWQEASVRIFAPNVKGLGANAIHTLAALAVHPVKTALQRGNFWARLQRSWGYWKLARRSRSLGNS